MTKTKALNSIIRQLCVPGYNDLKKIDLLDKSQWRDVQIELIDNFLAYLTGLKVQKNITFN